MNLLSVHIFKLFALLALLCGSVLSCDTEQPIVELKQNQKVYLCDAENPVDVDYGIGFSTIDDAFFIGGEGRCENCGVNNSAGIKLDSVNLYGMNLMLLNLKKGEYFELTVQEKESADYGAIIAKFTGGADFSLASDAGIAKEIDGWTTLSLNFKVLTDIDTAKFFVHTGGRESVFDDFKIVRYSQVPGIDSIPENALNLYINPKSDSILNANLAYCVNSTIIPNEMKNYVDAGIIIGRDTNDVEMRLKGDWTDHIKSGMPSYRIKTNNEYAFNGLRSFSIQHPRTRNYMNEWFFHKLLEKEDVLTTTYDFLPVIINNKFHGVYALEEHFDKQLLESRNRREGPILKIDESGFWSVLLEGTKEKLQFSLPYFEAAIPDVFKSNRTRKNPILLNQFLNGASLLNKFKSGDYTPEDIFDIEKEAKFYALMEIGNIMHGMAWHNRRFYFNPITQKLEHVAYDLQPGVPPQNKTRLTTELIRMFTKEQISHEHTLNSTLFANDEFRKHYLDYLIFYSSEKYMDSIMNELNDEIIAKEEMLSRSFPSYYFNRDFYFDRADSLRKELEMIQTTFAQIKPNGFANTPSNTDYLNAPAGIFVADISMNIYVEEIDSSNFILDCNNFHLADLTLKGFSIKANPDSLIPFDSPIKLNSFNDASGHTGQFQLNQKPRYIYFTAANMGDSLLRKKVLKWKKPKVEISRNALRNGFQTDNSLYEFVDGGILIKAGEYVCSDLIYIPKKYPVLVNSGVHIDFINGGGLITNNKTHFIGKADDPIYITSSDSSSSGISIINAEEVILRYLKVENLNTLNQEGWVLTGGINIYESDVFIDHLKIMNAQSEDALNLIRCYFTIDELEIDGTFSDGFDADFCDGSIENSKFSNTGNDCMDFSGSHIDGGNIQVVNSGDKAVSAGEGSDVKISEIHIQDAEIAFAAKDNSNLSIVGANVSGVKIGIAAFQKKPEYGPAHIILREIKYENVRTLGLLDKGSTCTYKGEVYKSHLKVDIEKLYAKFNKTE